MGKFGWLTIRNVPELDSTERGSYHRLLERFFKENRICPACGGHGHKMKNKGEVVPDATVKYLGISELEKLNKRGISITEVIREILERKVWKRRRCKVCKGSRFVPREGFSNVGQKEKKSSKSKG